jgi:VanZ family protein
MVLVSLAWSTRFRATAASFVIIAAACIAFGVAMELAQSVIPGRTCGLGDALANTGGTVLGFISVLLWRCVQTRRGSTKAAHKPVGEPAECRIQ